MACPTAHSQGLQSQSSGAVTTPCTVFPESSLHASKTCEHEHKPGALPCLSQSRALHLQAAARTESGEGVHPDHVPALLTATASGAKGNSADSNTPERQVHSQYRLTESLKRPHGEAPMSPLQGENMEVQAQYLV
ncbi:hypothetical protein TREES_T100012016 [Tupaia chinensis]|uniref:Uncharacterized protein n=1 Tax=Tupaia chinensis TaxID=246437 RepID=L9KPM9_TUPCH|nr:hypothetical protein TREES_T100012016 [Tupaia chinensis]